MEIFREFEVADRLAQAARYNYSVRQSTTLPAHRATSASFALSTRVNVPSESRRNSAKCSIVPRCRITARTHPVWLDPWSESLSSRGPRKAELQAPSLGPFLPMAAIPECPGASSVQLANGDAFAVRRARMNAADDVQVAATPEPTNKSPHEPTVRWPDHIQSVPQCPPPDAAPTSGTLYRRRDDGLSRKERYEKEGRAHKLKKDKCQCAALSCYDDLTLLKEILNVHEEWSDSIIVYAKLTHEHGVMKKTNGPGHYSLWLNAQSHARYQDLFRSEP